MTTEAVEKAGLADVSLSAVFAGLTTGNATYALCFGLPLGQVVAQAYWQAVALFTIFLLRFLKNRTRANG